MSGLATLSFLALTFAVGLLCWVQRRLVRRVDILEDALVDLLKGIRGATQPTAAKEKPRCP